MELYTVKALLGFASAALTAATAFTYAAPLVARLTGRAAVGAAARVIGARAAAVIGVRILCMTAGAWITVGIFAAQIVIWFVSDDALEEWCSLCALGNKRHSADACKDAKKLSAALEAALVKVGV